MAGTFPTLKSGNTVFYPLQDTQSFSTTVTKFLDDSEQRWRARPMLRRFNLQCVDINAYDSALILNFFRSQFGRFDPTWTLTIGANTYSNLAFNTDSFKITENKTNRHALSFQVVQVISDNPTIPTLNPYFPQINPNGVMTTLPYTSSFDYRSTMEDSDYTGRRFAWKWRSVMLGSYNLNLQALTAAELLVVQNFFYSAEGRKGEFTFLDPGGNLVNYSDLFSNASWTRTSITAGGNVTDPYGGNLAMSMSSSASNGLLYTTVLPSGNASGFVLCASVWARATGAGQTLSIGFVDSGFSVLANQIWTLPQNKWVRISCPITLATNSYIRILLGGFATWGSGQTIQLFGAQCVPLPGPGARLLTPGADGLRPYCRFDSDELAINFEDFGKTSTNLSIVEYTHA